MGNGADTEPGRTVARLTADAAMVAACGFTKNSEGGEYYGTVLEMLENIQGFTAWRHDLRYLSNPEIHPGFHA